MAEKPNFLGHEASTGILQNLWQSQRLPHALLFTGPEGIGKEKVARYLAKMILCEKDSGPCGACGGCRLVQDDKHPDLTFVLPEDGRIKIDTIRDLKKNFAFPPLMGKSRVLMIRDAHAMNIAAANALLKILEEPPPETFFILVTHALGWIPRTIVSRSQKFRFSPLQDKQVQTILKSSGIEANSALIKSAQGSPHKAQQLLQVQEIVPSVAELREKRGVSYDEAYELSQKIVEDESVVPFLEALLSQSHGILTQNQDDEGSFDLLHFTDKILELRRQLRLNLNPKFGLMRIMQYFKEPPESRL